MCVCWGLQCGVVFLTKNCTPHYTMQYGGFSTATCGAVWLLHFWGDFGQFKYGCAV